MKLTKRQKEVYNDLKNNGAIMITDSDYVGATVGFSRDSDKEDYHIGTRLFWNLVDKGVIWQQFRWPHGYIISSNFKLTP